MMINQFFSEWQDDSPEPTPLKQQRLEEVKASYTYWLPYNGEVERRQVTSNSH